MSNPKITPKNLHYTSTLPPFLQRLHSSNTSSSLGGRHEFAIARPKRPRDANADAEDEPAYVDEETNHTLSKEEYAALVGSGDRHPNPEAGGGEDAVAVEDGGRGKEKDGDRVILKGKDKEKDREQLAAIGASRKRKVGKVIGGSGNAEGEADSPYPEKDGEAKAKGEPRTGGEGQSTGEPAPRKGGMEKARALQKGKVKKIKLSFNDDEAA